MSQNETSGSTPCHANAPSVLLYNVELSAGALGEGEIRPDSSKANTSSLHLQLSPYHKKACTEIIAQGKGNSITKENLSQKGLMF